MLAQREPILTGSEAAGTAGRQGSVHCGKDLRHHPRCRRKSLEGFTWVGYLGKSIHQQQRKRVGLEQYRGQQVKGYDDGPVWDGPGPGSQERDGEKQGIQENYRKKSAQGLVIGRLKETMGQRQLELFFLCAKQYLLGPA